jgi:pimeloyl-ACP methyl ester carboxylesterase
MNDHPVTLAPAQLVTIVALHGNGGGAFRFERVAPHMPLDVSLHAVTLPGFAAVPRDPALRTLRDYAAYLSNLLADQPRPLVLLGHGIGGSIALEFAQRFAANIDGLILHAPVGTRLGSRLFPRLMALPGARSFGKWLFSSRLARPLFHRLLFRRPVPPALVVRFFDEYRQCAVFGQMFDLITPGWFRSLRPIGLPAALLWGERERVLTVDQLDDYRALLPNSLTRIVPDWDHFPMIEQPDEYARAIAALAQELIAR